MVIFEKSPFLIVHGLGWKFNEPMSHQGVFCGWHARGFLGNQLLTNRPCRSDELKRFQIQVRMQGESNVQSYLLDIMLTVIVKIIQYQVISH